MSPGNAPPLMRFIAAQGEMALALPYALALQGLDGAMVTCAPLQSLRSPTRKNIVDAAFSAQALDPKPSP